MSTEVSLENRDPKFISEHLQVSWSDVFAEPEGIRSPECAWTLSQDCYRGSKQCCYIFLSVLCAPLTALCCGFCFACVAFQNIWCTIPCLRIYRISCGSLKKFIMVCVEAVIIPFTYAFGHLLSAIKIKKQNITDESGKKDDVAMI